MLATYASVERHSDAVVEEMLDRNDGLECLRVQIAQAEVFNSYGGNLLQAGWRNQLLSKETPLEI